MNNILDLSILQISSLIKKKEISPVEIIKKTLNKIEVANKTNSTFITVCNEAALTEANIAEKNILNGVYKGPLHGVPISIKDNISVRNTRCTSGSIIDKYHISQSDALVVKQLRSQGAIISGKTNLDEFANNVTGINKNYGTIKNPLDLERSAGGSSGGSAASVASNLSYGSIGTDTSGSVRIPASFCGIVGLKPSYNLIPTLGVKPLSWSLDHVGILSKDCKDLSLLFNSIVLGSHKGSLYQEKGIKINQLTIGIPERYFFELLDKTVETKIEEIINTFSIHGAKIKYIKIPNMKKSADIQKTIISTEAAYYHKFNLPQAKDLYDQDNYASLKNGLAISKDRYNKALIQKQRISNDLQNIFSEIDILLTPTLPITAPKLTTRKVTWDGGYEEDILRALSRFTGPLNVSGLPAVTVPVGFNAEGLPIGLQIIGNMYHENQLISVGNWIMEKTN